MLSLNKQETKTIPANACTAVNIAVISHQAMGDMRSDANTAIAADFAPAGNYDICFQNAIVADFDIVLQYDIVTDIAVFANQRCFGNNCRRADFRNNLGLPIKRRIQF